MIILCSVIKARAQSSNQNYAVTSQQLHSQPAYQLLPSDDQDDVSPHPPTDASLSMSQSLPSYPLADVSSYPPTSISPYALPSAPLWPSTNTPSHGSTEMLSN